MREKRKVHRIIYLKILLSVGYILNSCSVDQRIVIKIISPYNCEYTLEVNGSSFSTRSTSQDFNKGNLAGNKEQVIQRVDTFLTDNDREKLLGVVKSIQERPIEFDSTWVRDGYLYELYFENELKKKKYLYDVDIFSIIKILRPYIKNEEIQCCEFFVMYDRANQ